MTLICFILQTMLFTTHSGFLYDKLRNKARKELTMDENRNFETLYGDEENSNTHANPVDDEEKRALLQYFRNCVVEHDKVELKKNMEISVEFRRGILKEPHEPIHKMFSFYFVDPGLVRKRQFIKSNYWIKLNDKFSSRFCLTLDSCSITLMENR